MPKVIPSLQRKYRLLLGVALLAGVAGAVVFAAVPQIGGDVIQSEARQVRGRGAERGCKFGKGRLVGGHGEAWRRCV